MPQRSKVHALPAEVLSALNERLYRGGFGGYADLSAWLAEQGFEISASSVRRYGARAQRRLEGLREAGEAARILCEGDTGSTDMAEASLRLIQKEMFDLMLASEERDIQKLSQCARSLAEAARASMSIKEARRKAVVEAAQRIQKVARRRGISPETEAMIRAAVEGIEPTATAELQKMPTRITPEHLRRIREDVYGIFDDPQPQAPFSPGR